MRLQIIWVNVINMFGELTIGSPFDTKKEAEESIALATRIGSTYIKTLEINNQEE